jgi:capsular polysaccharide biosynthesis protein/Mrp family chromosome partitioning ATPase
VTDLPHETQFRPSLLRDALRHHLWVILVLTALLGGTGAAGALAYPGDKESTAEVLVTPLYGSPFTTGAQGDQLTNLETEAQLVSTDAVGTIVVKKLGIGVSPSEAARTARGTVTTNTQVIKVSYSDRSARTAQIRAQAFAEGFLEYRRQRAVTRVTSQLKLLQAQEKTTREQLAKATGALSSRDTAASRTLTTEQIRTYTAELTRLTSAIAEESAIPTDPGQVISPADLPADETMTLAMLLGLVGALAGLVAGILAAITRERLDDRIRDVDDLDRIGVPWLGSSTARPTWSFTQAELTEDQRRMRTAVLGALPTTPAVVVVGRADGAGQAPASVRPLAAAMARAGVPVCVVEATPHGWPGESVVSDSANAGIAGVLLYNVPIESVLQEQDGGLATVPRGHWTGEVSDLLGNARMRSCLDWLRQRYEVVLIAAPSLQSADGQVLARLADGVLAEAVVAQTTNADLLLVVDQLSRAGVTVLGSVLIGSSSTRRLLGGGRSPQRDRTAGRPALDALIGPDRHISGVTGAGQGQGAELGRGRRQDAEPGPGAAAGTTPQPGFSLLRPQEPPRSPSRATPPTRHKGHTPRPSWRDPSDETVEIHPPPVPGLDPEDGCER